jgi:hypothetical protein
MLGGNPDTPNSSPLGSGFQNKENGAATPPRFLYFETRRVSLEAAQ